MNDVANVNIDAKLIRNNKNKDRDSSRNTTKDLADTIELANGCACTPFCCLSLPQLEAGHHSNTAVEACPPGGLGPVCQLYMHTQNPAPTCCRLLTATVKTSTLQYAGRLNMSARCAAGCNIQDELFDSFDQLLDLADRKGISYDR